MSSTLNPPDTNYGDQGKSGNRQSNRDMDPQQKYDDILDKQAKDRRTGQNNIGSTEGSRQAANNDLENQQRAYNQGEDPNAGQDAAADGEAAAEEEGAAGGEAGFASIDMFPPLAVIGAFNVWAGLINHASSTQYHVEMTKYNSVPPYYYWLQRNIHCPPSSDSTATG